MQLQKSYMCNQIKSCYRAKLSFSTLAKVNKAKNSYFHVRFFLLLVLGKKTTLVCKKSDTGGFSWFLVPKGNHEMRGSWIQWTVFSLKPQNGSKKFSKVYFLSLFSWKFDVFLTLRKIGKMINKWQQ